MGLKPERLAARDGWICWICGDNVDAATPVGSPWSATIDHVVPKSRGGSSEPENLRLAHRRCNGRRGNHLPELEWPERFGLLDAPSLWQSLRHIVSASTRSSTKPRRGRRRSGPDVERPVVVALAPTAELAAEAAEWAEASARRFLGGQWSATVEPTGVADCHVMKLSCQGPVLDPGRPV